MISASEKRYDGSPESFTNAMRLVLKIGLVTQANEYH